MSFIRGQTGLEYLLMIAGGVLLSAVVMVVVNNNLNLAAGQVNSTEYSAHIQNYLSTGVAGDDGDWVIVGNDQFSGVSGNVGIGTTNPGAKLEVSGNSKFHGTMNLSNNAITGLAAPVNDSDATNKAYVDAASGGSSIAGNISVTMNSTLNVGMPLQGVIDFNSNIAGYAMNTIPLSFPKAGCGVKITACHNAPVKMVIGADPVSRIAKTPINQGPGSIPATWSTYASSTVTGPQCGGNAFGTPAYCPNSSWYCVTGQQCCLNAYVGTGDWRCYSCGTAYPYIDMTNHVCYNNPRCSAASTGETQIQYSIEENTCIYCPADHPVYDPTSKNCIKDASVTTKSVGTACSTINTYLPTAFTDVSFLDASNAPSVSFVIKVAYNCPSD